MLKILDSMEFIYASKYGFTVSSNELEYEALLGRLRLVLAMNIEKLISQGDSNIIFNHVTGSFEAKEEKMKKYSTLMKSPIAWINATWFEKIDR